MEIYNQYCLSCQIQPELQFFEQLQGYENVVKSASLILAKPNQHAVIHILHKLPKLMRLSIDTCDLSQMFQEFVNSCLDLIELRELRLIDCKFSFQQSADILTTVQKFNKLKLLDLSKNNIQIPTQFISNLDSLCLRVCHINNPNQLEKLFLDNRRIVNVDLSQTSMKMCSNFSSLILSIFNNQPLTINVSYCSLTKPQQKEIFTLIDMNYSLQAIYLDNLTLVEDQQISKQLIKNWTRNMRKPVEKNMQISAYGSVVLSVAELK